jgi:hypothetical protein
MALAVEDLQIMFIFCEHHPDETEQEM